MISLAIMLALQDAGFGTYGETLFWNESPVMAQGNVSGIEGMWVNSLPSSVAADTYHDTITVSIRYRDPLQQTVMVARLLRWLEDNADQTCNLSCTPLIDCSLEIVKITRLTGATFEAVDAEGRWIQSITFDAIYKLPDIIPTPAVNW